MSMAKSKTTFNSITARIAGKKGRRPAMSKVAREFIITALQDEAKHIPEALEALRSMGLYKEYLQALALLLPYAMPKFMPITQEGSGAEPVFSPTSINFLVEKDEGGPEKSC
jgi:hypothetical protein